MTEEVGALVRQLRREQGWSAQRLAEECARVGKPSLTRGTIAKIESGVRKSVTAEELVALARALAVEPSDLLSSEPRQEQIGTGQVAADEPRDRLSWVASESLPDRDQHRMGLVGDETEVIRRGTATFRSSRPHQDGRASTAKRQVRDLTLDLARLHKAVLDRPVLDFSTNHPTLRIPSLGNAYISPPIRVTSVTQGSRLSDEAWWQAHPVRDDVEAFFLGYLTSPRAAEAPLLILGLPGSGKSVLIRVLAARLPDRDFLPMVIELRNVPASYDLQDQIELGIRAATGERIDWPGLARSLGDLLPVVLLDGFDELLQATGVSQTDYLMQVAAFQRREAAQGRRVAVIVTSRTGMVDHARVPESTTAIRLEPFDSERIASWLHVWNGANADMYANFGLQPLKLDAVLAYHSLAVHPLLLLMLTLIDADTNSLRHTQPLRPGQLYEKLLQTFVRREVAKWDPGLSGVELDQTTEAELRRLSITAFAMFNRSRSSVSQAELEADLQSLLGPSPSASDARSNLRRADILIGQFFFIHGSERTGSHPGSTSYEFLHRSFGEYLVARLTWNILRDLATREAILPPAVMGQVVDDDTLHSLLSFTPLSARAQVVDFLTEMASSLDRAEQDTLADLLMRLFRVVFGPRHSHGYAAYEPRRLPVPTRYAAYSANLVLLAVCVVGTITISQLYNTNPVSSWHRDALLWRSQLDEGGWHSLVAAISIDRIWTDGLRDIRLTLRGDTHARDDIDLQWIGGDTLSSPAANYPGLSSIYHPDELRRRAYFQSDIDDDLVYHALEPLMDALGDSTDLLAARPEHPSKSPAHALLEAWLAPVLDLDAEDRYAIYSQCVRIVLDDSASWNDTTRYRYSALLLDRLATDEALPPTMAIDILSMLEVGKMHGPITKALRSQLIRCLLIFRGRERNCDERIAQMLSQLAIAAPSE